MNVVYVNGNEVIIKEALQKLYLKRKVSIDEMWCLKHYIDYLERQENNLQSKIDKAIEYINTHEYPSIYGLRKNDLSKKELLDILKEDK